jgi:hypothetical protein
MHTEGVDECPPPAEEETWIVRAECLGCGLKVGAEAPPGEAAALVDRLMWTDDALYELERLPPYVEPLVRQEVLDYARANGRLVVTVAVMRQARQGGAVEWEPEAERRLDRIPGPVRAMARVELERTAAERGHQRVTVALMEEVKARYFGMGSAKREA